jgi:hypothetical protein
MTLTLGLRRRGFLEQSTTAASASWSRGVQEHEPQRVSTHRVVGQGRDDWGWIEREDKKACGKNPGVERARHGQRHTLVPGRGRGLEHGKEWATGAQKLAPQRDGFRMAQEGRPTPKRGTDTSLRHASCPSNLPW